MSIVPRTLLIVLGLSFPVAGTAYCQDETAPSGQGNTLQEKPPGATSAADEELITRMQEEIRLREELARKIEEGAPESEIANLRAALERLESERRSTQQVGDLASEDTAESVSAKGAAAGPTADGESAESVEELTWWRFLESTARDHPFPLAAVLVALLVRLAAGWKARRWLASARSRLPERQDGVDEDSRWREAERFLLLSASLAIFVALVAVLLVESGFLGGAAIAVLFALGLAGLWLLRHAAEDAVGGLTLLTMGSYQVGDLVDLAGSSGVVEKISLFATTLRDMDGSLAFVPHRLVNSVRNSTYDWARAVVEVAVARDEDVDRIMKVLFDVARDVTQSPSFAEMILEEPRMLGVESIDPSQVVIKFFLKTAPRNRSMVTREVRRRVHQRFRELGIEAPLPARRLHHRIEKPERGPDEGSERA